MMDSRSVAALFCVAVLLSLSACSDLTSVGSELGEEPLDGGTPETFEIVPDSFTTTTIASQTGFNIPATISPERRRQWRFLTGTVSDPLVGTIQTDGFIDFVGAADPPAGLRDTTLDALQAELRLLPTYLHGDTSSFDVEVYDLTEEAEMSRARADTTFAAESTPLATVTISPTDSLVTLPLPQSWIEEHREALRDTSEFEDRINGLKISGANGNTVVGFEHGTATLRLKTSEDSIDYRTQKTFTHIERRNRPPSDPNRRVLLGGVGVGLSMFFDDDSVLDSLRQVDAPLNRAEITIPVDTTTHQTAGAFRRPLPNGYRVRATRTDESPRCAELSLFARSDGSRTCFFSMNQNWVPYAARTQSQSTFIVFDQWLSGPPLFSSMRVEVASQERRGLPQRQTVRRGLPSTIPVVVRTGGVRTKKLPRVTLVVTPL